MMRSYTSTAGSRLIAELRVLRDYPFQQRCGLILQAVFPALVETPAGSDLDNAGIDHCLDADETDEMVLAFQCKGFRGQEFGPSQLSQCLHSIEMFAHSDFETKQYFLVVNQIVKGDPRKKIEAALNELVHPGKTEVAQ